MKSWQVGATQLLGACAISAWLAALGCDDAKKSDVASVKAEPTQVNDKQAEEQKAEPPTAEAPPQANAPTATTAANAPKEAKPEEAESEAQKRKTAPKNAAGAKPAAPPVKAVAKQGGKPASAKPTKPAAAKPAAYDGPNPCLKKSFKFGGVRHACQTGGVKKAKNVMKYYVKKGKEKGRKFKCSTCHDNTKTYTNKPNAAKDLKWILAK